MGEKFSALCSQTLSSLGTGGLARVVRRTHVTALSQPTLESHLQLATPKERSALGNPRDGQGTSSLRSSGNGGWREEAIREVKGQTVKNLCTKCK